MKLVMIFDQIQAGAGGKEKANEGLNAKRGPIGSAKMFEPHFKAHQIDVTACLYCGDQFYRENQQEVKAKMIAMIKKLQPDAVLCGPAFNYEGYAQMAIELADAIQSEIKMPVIAACSADNQSIIENYKDRVHIVKMPKKGGTGLSQALENMSTLLDKMVHNDPLDDLLLTICY